VLAAMSLQGRIETRVCWGASLIVTSVALASHARSDFAISAC
jgi:hypothetical protein